MSQFITAQAIPNDISHHHSRPLATTRAGVLEEKETLSAQMQPPTSWCGSARLWVPTWWLSSWILGTLLLVASAFEHGEVSSLQYAASGNHHSSMKVENCNSLSPVTTGSLLLEETLGVSTMKTLPRRLQRKGTWTKVSLTRWQNSDLHTFNWKPG